MSDEIKPAEAVEPEQEEKDLSADPEAAEDDAFAKFVSAKVKKVKGSAQTEKAREVKASKDAERKAAPAPLKEDEDEPELKVPAKAEKQPTEAPKAEEEEEPKPGPSPEEEAKAKKAKVAEDAARFAAIERRERQARQVEAQAKSAQEQVERLKAEAETAREEARRHYQHLEGIRRDPRALLSWAGYTMDDVVRTILDDGRLTPEYVNREVERRIQQQMSQWEERQAAQQRQFEQENQRRQAEVQERTLREFQQACVHHVKSDPEKYELIASKGLEERVFQYIERWFDAHGEILDIPTAAERVEADLLEEAESFLKTKKLGSRFQVAAPVAPTKQAPATREKAASTLTNSLVTSPATPDPDALLKMSEEDGIEYMARKVRAARKG
jgi:hypothetical protein